MAKRKLFSQLFIPSLGIIIIVVLSFSWLIVQSVESFYYHEKSKELKAQAVLVGQYISNEYPYYDSDLLKTCQDLGALTGTRITIIAASGKVLGDSDENPEVMDNHNDRPEIIKAREKGIGTVIRYSHTLDQEMMYLAVPITLARRTLVIRTSLPITSLQENIAGIRRTVLFIGMFIVLMAGGISFFLSKRIAKPLRSMQQSAEQFALGNFTAALPVSSILELGSLSESLTRMTQQLHERIQTILRERNEREALLSSMSEGVLAVDLEGKIISLNKAAEALFQIQSASATGNYIGTIIRNSTFIEFVENVLAGEGNQEIELTISNAALLYLNITGANLFNESNQKTGAVFVLNDITRIRRLENIRKEFVANVSHELKTPITAIKGFTETLRTVSEPEKKRHFLDILEKHSNRLNAIIDDLLELSRIEQSEGIGNIRKEPSLIQSVLAGALKDCARAAADRKIDVAIQCDRTLKARINAPLLQQAVVNLLDNALKYSGSARRIIVSGRKDNTDLIISVEDFGIGISPEHWDRLFERFYRVDKARSKTVGGTGLGLAIAKHIARIHNGDIIVNSTVGKGSVFSILLPLTV